jgi:hypothetical protein
VVRSGDRQFIAPCSAAGKKMSGFLIQDPDDLMMPSRRAVPGGVAPSA